MAVAGGYKWKEISAGGSFTCGIQTNDSLWCWGGMKIGDGSGEAVNYLIPTPAGLDPIERYRQLTTGYNHACAIRISDDTLWCLGLNDEGQLGSGDTYDTEYPRGAAGPTAWAAVSAGEQYTCGMKASGQFACFGLNDVGQLGDGTTNSSLVHVPVAPFIKKSSTNATDSDGASPAVVPEVSSGKATPVGAIIGGVIGGVILIGKLYS